LLNFFFKAANPMAPAPNNSMVVGSGACAGGGSEGVCLYVLAMAPSESLPSDPPPEELKACALPPRSISSARGAIRNVRPIVKQNSNLSADFILMLPPVIKIYCQSGLLKPNLPHAIKMPVSDFKTKYNDNSYLHK
jgi:hypothetical protein